MLNIPQKHNKKNNISGKNIKKIRKDKHLNQGELATKLQLNGISMTPSTISKIESQSRMVTDKELLAFSKVLGTGTQKLVEK